MLAPGAATAADAAHTAHAEPFTEVLMLLALAIVVAMLGRWVARRARQPSVLGELLAGVVVGNLFYAFGGPVATVIMHLDVAGAIFSAVWQTGDSVQQAATQALTATDLRPGGPGERVIAALTGSGGAVTVLLAAALWIFSNLGVILLLFMVGLETRVQEMARVGVPAALVAIAGVLAPFTLGYAACTAVLPDSPMTTRLFVAVTLVATSVGITARVFKDLGLGASREAKIILGAAVIDDVLGLVLLAVVVGIVTTGAVRLEPLVQTVAISIAFLAAVVLAGGRAMPALARLAMRVDPANAALLLPLVVAALVSWSANLAGLAAIIGAFAAGLIVNDEDFGAGTEPRASPSDALAPVEALFAPLFFVLVGMQVDLRAFADLDTLLQGAVFVVAAAAGKLASGLAAGSGADRLTVGIGMMPRGEVGLVFASMGKALGVLDDALFSAIVLMVIATTLAAPPALEWSLARRRSQ
jgi:Kef-type K+ transport system membrane component KefB